MANIEVDVHFNSDYGTDHAEQERLRQQKSIFDARFWRRYRTLHLIACRVLGGPERAEEAIGSCWRRASRHPRWFERESEFYSWLLRVLIDEALVLLRESMPTPATKVLCEPVPTQIFRSNGISDENRHISDNDQDVFSEEFFMALE
jgi:DNA-directed RNA polymerase specialized sigma24 family protein